MMLIYHHQFFADLNKWFRVWEYCIGHEDVIHSAEYGNFA